MPPPTLRAKMYVESVKSVAGPDGSKTQEELGLLAVYGPEGSANRTWSNFTPAGAIYLVISNPDAFGKALPGQFFFVDLHLTTADALEPAPSADAPAITAS